MVYNSETLEVTEQLRAFCTTAGTCLYSCGGHSILATSASLKMEPLGWVAPRLCCGIGNRLFQAIAATAFAKRTGREAVLLLPRMCHYEHGNFELIAQLFPHLRIIETATDWETIDEHTPLTQSQAKRTVLSGFFQDAKFFPDLSDQAAWPRIPLPPTLTPRVAVHFRLGDYKILPHHQLPLASYYYHMITSFPKQTPLLLFSDSPEALPAIQAELAGLGYPSEVFTGTPLETFIAFSSCQGGAVCSNSTFAWWCAYFAWNVSGSDSYIAHFPSPWMPGKPPPNLFTHPFTQVHDLVKIPAFSRLNSFSYL